MSEQAAAYLVKSAMRSANRRQLEKDAFFGAALAIRSLLGNVLTRARREQWVRPLSNYYKNMAREGFNRGITGGTDAPFPRMRNVMSVVAPRLSGTADYEYARMMGNKLRERGVLPEQARASISQMDPRLVEAAVHKHLISGVKEQPKSRLWDMVRNRFYGKDRPRSSMLAVPAIGAAEGLLGWSPLSGIESVATELPSAVVAQAAQEGRPGLLQKIKGSLIAHGAKGKTNPLSALPLLTPEVEELYDIGKDINRAKVLGEHAVTVARPFRPDLPKTFEEQQRGFFDDLTAKDVPWGRTIKEEFWHPIKKRLFEPAQNLWKRTPAAPQPPHVPAPPIDYPLNLDIAEGLNMPPSKILPPPQARRENANLRVNRYGFHGYETQ